MRMGTRRPMTLRLGMRRRILGRVLLSAGAHGPEIEPWRMELWASNALVDYAKGATTAELAPMVTLNRHTIGTQRERESPFLDSPASVNRYFSTTSLVGTAGFEPATP